MNVLELYSGIGGMHLALEESGVIYNVKASIEINPGANEVYKLNFPNTPLYNLNIEGLTADFIKKLNVDTILMSPPCQPFTRNGLKNDIKDPRTVSFIHILQLLPDLNIKQLLIENVKGFEKSEMRETLIQTLIENKYTYQELIISPHQIGIPNSRHRYYCLAKKDRGFTFQVGNLLTPNIGHEYKLRLTKVALIHINTNALADCPREQSHKEEASKQVLNLNIINKNTDIVYAKVLKMNVLELYSGIGGMHLALEESGVIYNVKASIEINPGANEVYKLNFPNTPLYNLNIEGLTADFIKKLNVDTILMSPPCQPFTRNGLKNDIKDPRTVSFIHILQLLPDLNIKQLLIENVKGFEKSEMRETLIQTLIENKYTYQELIISPHQIGIPNSRHRYYCLAKKDRGFTFQVGNLMENLPTEANHSECYCIEDILESNIDQKYFISDKILQKYFKIMDICYKNSNRSCCFTKAYGRFIEGTGSVFTEKPVDEVENILHTLKNSDIDMDRKLKLLKSLDLRFFTPREVCRLMCFPEVFNFPETISDRKKYMLLGNSINIKVVAKLIKLLIT